MLKKVLNKKKYGAIRNTFPWLLFSGAVVCDDLHRIIALTRFNEENKV
jgi:hypothetical protein